MIDAVVVVGYEEAFGIRKVAADAFPRVFLGGAKLTRFNRVYKVAIGLGHR